MAVLPTPISSLVRQSKAERIYLKVDGIGDKLLICGGLTTWTPTWNPQPSLLVLRFATKFTVDATAKDSRVGFGE